MLTRYVVALVEQPALARLGMYLTILSSRVTVGATLREAADHTYMVEHTTVAPGQTSAS